MTASPTQRTLKHMRERGFTCAVVERWNPHARIRQDLYGFADILAMKPGEGVIAIQVTSASNRAARLRKVLSSAHAETWVASGGRVMVHGWGKGSSRFWKLKEEEITHDRFARDQDERGDGAPENPLS